MCCYYCPNDNNYYYLVDWISTDIIRLWPGMADESNNPFVIVFSGRMGHPLEAPFMPRGRMSEERGKGVVSVFNDDGGYYLKRVHSLFVLWTRILHSLPTHSQ